MPCLTIRKYLVYLFAVFIFLAGFILPPISASSRDAAEKIPGFLEKENQIKYALYAVDLLFHRRYDEAENLFQGWAQEWPTSILGPLGMLGLYELKNFENYSFTAQLEELPWQKRSYDWAKEIYEREKSEDWEYLAAGGALGTSGFYQVQRGKWVRGLGEAILAFRVLKKSITNNPQFKDALVGIGLYEFWRSVFTQRFRFLPFFPDERQKGIQDILTSIQEGQYVAPLGEASLAFVYFQEKDFKKTEEICQKFLKKFPENIIVRLLYANSLSATKKFDQAHHEYQKILRQVPTNTITPFFIANNLYHQKQNLNEAQLLIESFLQTNPSKRLEAQAHALLGNILLAQDDKEGAKRHYRKALSLNHSLPLTRQHLKELIQTQ